MLLSNDGTLPLPPGGASRSSDRMPTGRARYSAATRSSTTCSPQHPAVETGIEVATVLEALRDGVRRRLSVAPRSAARWMTTTGPGFGEAVAAAAEADVAILVMGDHAGLFGRGTVGEGCDRDDLELPGVQRELVEAVLATGTPVVLVLVTGRPYAVDWALARCAAVVQAFFPGEEGAGAIARVLSGRVNPSGRLPVSLPRSAGAQPYSYLHPTLGEGDEVSNLATTPAAPFGHGLSYTTFEHTEPDRAGPGADRRGDRRLGAHDEHRTGRRRRRGAALRSRPRRLGDPAGGGSCSATTGCTWSPASRSTVEFTVPTTRLAFSDRSLHPGGGAGRGRGLGRHLLTPRRPGADHVGR